jgi:hypothetical protein
LLDARKKFGLEIYARSCFITRIQVKAVIKIANKSLKNLAKFEYLGMAATNQIAFTKKLRTD